MTTDVVVLGAGAIGAAVAWRCAGRGLRVTVVDPQQGRGAWHTAAGMLAPLAELHFTETALLRLNLDSSARYADFVAELTDSTGLPVGYRTEGAIALAWDGADFAYLRRLHGFATGLGLEAQMLSGAEVRRAEPALAPGLAGGMLARHDHQVDPRVLHAALLAAGTAAGVQTVRSAPTVLTRGDRVTGVRLADGTTISCAQVVLAAGCWSAQVDGVPAYARPPVRPVKGQTLRLQLPDWLHVEHVLRATVQRSPVYVVPRADGRVVVGASSQESGFDVSPRAGAIYELLRDAQAILPELDEAVLEDVSTGLRPGSPDNAPIIGPAPLEGLVHATGHFRNGILLTPVTADGVADLIADGAVPPVLEPFAPARFADVASAQVGLPC